MKVRKEGDSHIDDGQTRDAFLRCRDDASHDARAEVDQVRRAVDDDCRRRTGPLRIRAWCSGAEQDDLRALCRSAARLELGWSVRGGAILRTGPGGGDQD